MSPHAIATSDRKWAPNITRLNDASSKIGVITATAIGRHFTGIRMITESVAAAVAASPDGKEQLRLH